MNPASFVNGVMWFIAWGQSGTVVVTGSYPSVEFGYRQTVAQTAGGAVVWDTHNPAKRSWFIKGSFYVNSIVTGGGGSVAIASIMAAQQGTVVIGQFGSAAGQSKLGGRISWELAHLVMERSSAMMFNFVGLGNGVPAWPMGSVFP